MVVVEHPQEVGADAFHIVQQVGIFFGENKLLQQGNGAQGFSQVDRDFFF